MFPVILTRYGHKTCFASDSPQARNLAFNLNYMLLCLDDWEALLHKGAQALREVLPPHCQQADPAIVNKTARPIDALGMQRLVSAYMAMWASADPEENRAANEMDYQMVAQTAFCLSHQFEGRAQIVFDYSAHAITVY